MGLWLEKTLQKTRPRYIVSVSTLLYCLKVR
nr:MAG TPA: hypothetical protein [Caudoviricetes sp.]